MNATKWVDLKMLILNEESQTLIPHPKSTEKRMEERGYGVGGRNYKKS